jgi:hypothetical protein
MSETERQLRMEIARLKLDREEMLGILSDLEIITKTHLKALRDAELIQRTENALEKDEP